MWGRDQVEQGLLKSGKITDDNRQKFLQALGTLRRKAAKRVIYKLSPKALVSVNTSTRQVESCSAAELRRGSKTVFYVPGCESTLVDEQPSALAALSGRPERGALRQTGITFEGVFDRGQMTARGKKLPFRV